MTSIASQIDRVVSNGNCTGCGWCAAMFQGVAMEMSPNGFMRPRTHGRGVSDSKNDVSRFRSACPGVQVKAPELDSDMKVHEVFGRYHAVFQGWANDSQIRERGSSAGVLTALSTYITQKNGKPGLMAGAAVNDQRRTVPVRITTREEALAAAGSRYAPVSVASEAHIAVSSVTAKPCEIAALRADRQSDSDAVLLSFFCAGTPSQEATSRLIHELDVQSEEVSTLRYRGNGWPGEFTIETKSGSRSSTTYEESWGRVLGRNLQSRCKICVDGTGEAADIAVGDYWEASEEGYPLFTEQAGRSVVIARTIRGLNLLRECAEDGVITIGELSIEKLMAVQPLQVKRRRTLPGRLLGKLMTGRRIPNYPGYSLTKAFLRNPKSNVRAALGSAHRGVRTRLEKRGRGR